jgi:hypothetical protein
LFGDTLQIQQRVEFANSASGSLHTSCADVNGDGRAEIIYAASTRLYVVDLESNPLPGYPIEFPVTLIGWTLLVDFDGTGTHDILFASASRLYCYHPDGTPRSGFPIVISGPPYTPSVADIDGNGKNEVIFTTTASKSSWPLYGDLQVTVLHAIDGRGREVPGWPTEVYTTVQYVRHADTLRHSVSIQGFVQTPLIASIDGDLIPEILFTSVAGKLYVLNANGTLRDGYPIFVGTQNPETGVLGDFDGDGTLNYVVRSDRVGHSNAELICLDFGPGSYNPNCIPWPMHLQNPERTGILPTPIAGSIINHVETDVPSEFALEQNYPNPFNPTTVIRYQVTGISRADLRVYDVLGREVAVLVNKEQEPGKYAVQFDASKLQSGTYFYRLIAGEYRAVRKMVVVK